MGGEGSGAGLPWSRRSRPQLARAAAPSPRIGGQSQAALAAPDLEPQRPKTGGIGAQEHPALEVRGQKLELKWEGNNEDCSWGHPLLGGEGSVSLLMWEEGSLAPT